MAIALSFAISNGPLRDGSGAITRKLSFSPHVETDRPRRVLGVEKPESSHVRALVQRRPNGAAQSQGGVRPPQATMLAFMAAKKLRASTHAAA